MYTVFELQLYNKEACEAWINYSKNGMERKVVAATVALTSLLSIIPITDTEHKALASVDIGDTPQLYILSLVARRDNYNPEPFLM